MEKNLERVKAVLTLGSGAIANYSDNLKLLNTVSDEISKNALQVALKQQEMALKNAN